MLVRWRLVAGCKLPRNARSDKVCHFASWQVAIYALCAAFFPATNSNAEEQPPPGLRPTHFCPEGQKLDPHRVWVKIGSRRQAEAFVQREYEKIRDVDAFARWLACQDFLVEVSNGKPGSAEEGNRFLSASYVVKGQELPLWQDGPPNATFPALQHLTVKFDSRGKIENPSAHSVRE